jgi:hypothetical protein
MACAPGTVLQRTDCGWGSERERRKLMSEWGGVKTCLQGARSDAVEVGKFELKDKQVVVLWM